MSVPPDLLSASSSSDVLPGEPAAPRVLHVVETWAPVASGYTRRGGHIVAAQIATGSAVPGVLVSSRQVLYGHDSAAPPTGGLGVRVARVSSREARLRRLHRWYVDETALVQAIMAAARAMQAELIHCHWSSSIGSAARRAARSLGLPLVAEVRFDLAGAMMSETVRYPVPGLENILRWHFDHYLRGADAVVAASHTLARLLERAQKTERGSVQVMPNAVDRCRFVPVPDAGERLRRRLGLAGTFVVGSTTNMLRYEGLDTLLDAARRLQPHWPELVIVLVGDGTQRAGLQDRARRLRLPVRFLGRVEAAEIPAYLALFDLFVVPRHDAAVTRHASPIKLVEAQACGVPAIGSALGDIPDILAHGGGRCVPPGDSARLAEAIADFAAHDTVRAEAARAARQWADRQPDWNDLARDYGGLYHRVLEARGQR